MFLTKLPESLFGLDEIAPPQFGRIELHLGGGGIDQALDHVRGLRSAGAAVGVDRHRVGEGAEHVHVGVLDVVEAGEQLRAGHGRDHRREVGQIGAHVRLVVNAERQHLAVLVERQFGVGDVVAALGIRYEGLGPFARPLDRAADFLGGPRHQCLLDVGEHLHAETAAHVGRHDAQLVVLHTERAGDDVLHHVHVLAGRVERVTLVLFVVDAERTTRLHRVDHDPVVGEVDLGDVMRPGEGCVDRGPVAVLPIEHAIAGGLFPHLRSALLQRVCQFAHGRQDVIIDLDQFSRVFRLFDGFGDDQSDVIADRAHVVLFQERVGRQRHLCAVARGQRCQAWNSAELVMLDVGAGENGEHALGLAGGRHVDRPDPGVRVRRAEDVGVGLVGYRHVVEVTAAAREQPLIFLAAHRLPDAELTHVCPPELFGPWFRSASATIGKRPRRTNRFAHRPSGEKP
jgi:hypothetical protein